MKIVMDQSPKTIDKLFAGNNWVLPTDVTLVGPAADAFESRAMKVGWSEDEVGFLKIAVNEAIANAMKHGNKNDPEKSVYVHLEINEKTIAVTIRDQGEGFDSNTVPDPTKPENLKKTSGRGVLIMKNYFDKDKVTFKIIKSEDGTETLGTEVKMIKTREKKG